MSNTMPIGFSFALGTNDQALAKFGEMTEEKKKAGDRGGKGNSVETGNEKSGRTDCKLKIGVDNNSKV